MKIRSIALALVLAMLSGLAGFAHARVTATENRGAATEDTQSSQDTGAAALAEGRRLLRRGNAEQALPLLERALDLFNRSSDRKGAAATHDALGDLYSRQGQYKVALDQYGEAQRGFSSINDSYNANLMLSKIGEMYYRVNRIAEARASYEQMNVRKPDTNALNVANSAQSKVNRARGLLGRVRGIASSSPSTSTPAEVSSTGSDAISQARAGRDLYRQFIIYSVHELGLGRVDYFSRSFEAAGKHFENALSAAGGSIPGIAKLGQTRRFRVAARTGLGDIAYSQGRYDDAIRFYTEAREGARRDERPDLVWPAERGLGRSMLAQAAGMNDPTRVAITTDNAIKAYRDALKTIEAIRAGSLKSDESLSTFLATTRDVFDEASAALAERALTGDGNTSTTLSGSALDDAGEAFDIVEQGRARALLDMLGETGANLTAGVPPDLLKRKQENLDRQQEIARELTGVGGSEDTAAKTNEALESELAQLETEFDRIENDIRAASPRYSEITAPRPLSLQQVQSQVLDGQTVLLEYSLGEKASYLWAITDRTASLYRLPARAIIEQQATDLRAQMIPARLRVPLVDTPGSQTVRGLGLGAAPPAASTSNASGFASAASALYRSAVAPAEGVIGNKRLLVVPDGALSYVPFGTLVTGAGGADYAALPYLVKTHEIASAPSASVMPTIRQHVSRAPSGSVLIIADPVFSASDPRANGAAQPAVSAIADSRAGGATERGLGLASAVQDIAGPAEGSAPVNNLGLARLAGTRIEAEQIAQVARASGRQADTWLDLEANETNVKTRDTKRYRVVHIATHGLLDGRRPQFTGLVLSLVGNRDNDGFLRTDEIFNLDLGSPLVMLSACETGLGREKRGEGVIGLSRAFLYAGAPAVGVSLWPVADRSTADLMTGFYKRLFAGQNVATTAALRGAQLDMIAGKRYSAPFYWAPFILVGEWR